MNRKMLFTAIIVTCCFAASTGIFAQGGGGTCDTPGLCLPDTPIPPVVSGCDKPNLTVSGTGLPPFTYVGGTVDITPIVRNETAPAIACNVLVEEVRVITPDGTIDTIDVTDYWLLPGGQVTYPPVSYVMTAADIPSTTARVEVDGQTQFAEGLALAEAAKNFPFTLLSPDLSISKDCLNFPAPGDPLNVGGEVCNTGDTELVNIQVSNSTGYTETIAGPLAPGACVPWGPDSYTPAFDPAEPICEATDTVSATALAPAIGLTVGPVSDTAICQLDCAPALEVTKECLTTTPSQPGDTVSFEVCVTNTGNVDLVNVQVTDGTGLNETIPLLAAGAGPTCFTVTEVVDSCSDVLNLATASATFGATELEDSDEASCPVVCEPCIDIQKACISEVYALGEPVCYEIRLENCGDIPLDTVVVTDDTAAGTFPSTLAVGEVVFETVCMAPQEECSVEGVEVTNTASVTANSAGGAVSDGPASDTCEVVCDPCIEVTKECVTEEDTILIGGEVCNCGDIPLTNVSVVDSDLGQLFGGSLDSGQCAPYDGAYTPGECGEFTDTVNASADSAGGPVSDGPATATCEIECDLPALCLTPGYWGTHACDRCGYDDAGDLEPADGKSRCENKNGGYNITQAVLNLGDPGFEICGGIVIDDTELMSPNSAVEAICEKDAGNKLNHMVRDIVATGLNCLLSGTPSGNLCAGLSFGEGNVQEIWNLCNDLCEFGADDAAYAACGGALDCFNNGGHLVNVDLGAGYFGECVFGDDLYNCHDEAKRSGICKGDDCQFQSAPAGSGKACNEAIGNMCHPAQGGCTGGVCSD